MKIFYRSNCFRGMLKPMATLLLFFVLIVSANAQTINEDRIVAPQVVTAIGSLDPDLIVGTVVIEKDASGNICPDVTYEWQSATNEFFTENLVTNLANTKDYDPGVLTVTTFFRRISKINCLDGSCSINKCSGIKITIN